MEKRTGLVTFQGNPLTLVGNEVKVGALAPDFEVLNNELAPVKLSSYKGKVVLLTAVPSLDTPVCELETMRFNNEAAGLGDEVVILTVSMDLPFAQKRWSDAQGADKIVTLSDHRDAAFGTDYGLLIEELRLLARAVLVIDREGVIRYMELVKEIAQEPDYDAALQAARGLV